MDANLKHTLKYVNNEIKETNKLLHTLKEFKPENVDYVLTFTEGELSALKAVRDYIQSLQEDD